MIIMNVRAITCIVLIGLTVLCLTIQSNSLSLAAASTEQLKVIWQQFLPGITGTSVVQTQDGGYMVLGNNASLQIDQNGRHSYSNYDQVLVKTDSNGNVTLTKEYHLTGFQRLEPGQIIKTSDDAYVIACVAVADNNPLNNRVALLKIDAAGNIVWSKLLLGYNPDHTDTTRFGVNAFIKTSDNGFAIITGYGYHMYGSGLWFNKVDDAGNLQLNRSIASLNWQTYVGKIIQTTDGGYMLFGSRGGHPNFHGPAIMFKIDPNGDVEWEKTFGGEGSYYYAYCHDAVVTLDGGYLLGGSVAAENDFYTTHGWLIKTDALGNQVWNETLGSDKSGIVSVTQAGNGTYVFVGRVTTYAVWIGQIDAAGALQAQTQIQTQDSYGNIAPNEVIVAGDGSAVFAGTWANTSDQSFSYMWLVKIDLSRALSSLSPDFSVWIRLSAVIAVLIITVAILVARKKLHK